MMLVVHIPITVATGCSEVVSYEQTVFVLAAHWVVWVYILLINSQESRCLISVVAHFKTSK